jgi:hypothetical protein
VPDLAKYADKALDDLSPARVLRLFKSIPEVDVPLLDLACRPEHLLMTCATESVQTIPVCIVC